MPRSFLVKKARSSHLKAKNARTSIAADLTLAPEYNPPIISRNLDSVLPTPIDPITIPPYSPLPYSMLYRRHFLHDSAGHWALGQPLFPIVDRMMTSPLTHRLDSSPISLSYRNLSSRQFSESEKNSAAGTVAASNFAGHQSFSPTRSLPSPDLSPLSKCSSRPLIKNNVSVLNMSTTITKESVVESAEKYESSKKIFEDSQPEVKQESLLLEENSNDDEVFQKTVGYTYDTFFVSDGRSRKRKPEVSPNCRQRYSCSECGKNYATSSNLSRHKQTHRSLDSKLAKQCPHCDKRYVSMPALSMHVLTHDLKHKCTICNKSFSRPWLLQGHLRSHSGEKPYGCAHCGKAFADRSNLRAHMQTHSLMKQYCCKRCGKGFALKSYLNKHLESACFRDTDIAPMTTSSEEGNVEHASPLVSPNSSLNSSPPRERASPQSLTSPSTPLHYNLDRFAKYNSVSMALCFS